MVKTFFYICEDCDFSISNSRKFFYYDEQSGKIIAEMRLKSNFDVDANSKIRGNVFDSFCSRCGRYVRTYMIRYWRVDNPDERIYYGIQKDLDEYIKKVFELRQIKERQNYSIEKVAEKYYIVRFPDLDNYSSNICYESKLEALEEELVNFNCKIESKINALEESYQSKSSDIYRVMVEGEDNTGFCPECGSNIPLQLNCSTPCPKCGGRLKQFGAIYF